MTRWTFPIPLRQVVAWVAVLFAASFVTMGLAGTVSRSYPRLGGGMFAVIYLIFGVKLLLAWMYGWLSLLITVPVLTVCALLYFGPDAMTAKMVLLLAIKLVALPLAFEITRMFGVDARGGVAHPLQWRWLLLVGFIASVIIQIARLGLLGRPGTPPDEAVNLVASIAADMLGAAAVLVLAMLWFRGRRMTG